jgi:hypothetical protein
MYGWWTSFTYMKQNQKSLVIALIRVGRRLRRRDDEGNVNNV